MGNLPVHHVTCIGYVSIKLSPHLMYSESLADRVHKNNVIDSLNVIFAQEIGPIVK